MVRKIININSEKEEDKDGKKGNEDNVEDGASPPENIRKGGGREGGEWGQDEASSELGKEEDIDLSYSEKEEFHDGYYDDYVAKERVEDKEGILPG